MPAIVSTAVGLLGGHATAHLLVGVPRSGHESLITTTSGPGVSGMGVFSSWAPRTPPLLSQMFCIDPSHGVYSAAARGYLNLRGEVLVRGHGVPGGRRQVSMICARVWRLRLTTGTGSQPVEPPPPAPEAPSLPPLARRPAATQRSSRASAVDRATRAMTGD